jgi:LmbE family N-acetylglucosaminyl deacetylase
VADDPGLSDQLRLEVDGAPLERALVVTAHPDDVDFAAGGTVAAWTEAGVSVSYCICTDGDAGGFDLDLPRTEMPGIRRAEQTEAAKVLGVSDLHWLGFPDGALEVGMDLRRAISRVIRLVRPQRVVCGSPQRSWRSVYASHPDHLAAGEATLCAVYPDARNPFAFPELLAEGLEPHAVAEVWVMEQEESDRVVDVTDQLERKLSALRCHVSQRTDRDGQLEGRMRAWMGGTAQAGGLAADRLAESFRSFATA